MASEWHIARVLEALTACCSNFVGKAGRSKVTMIVVGFLVVSEIVFETKTLVDARKRKDLLRADKNLASTVHVTREDRRCARFFSKDYNTAYSGYVTCYALGIAAEIVYFAVWINIFYHRHYKPRKMHMVQIFIAVALELPLVISSWCMLEALPGNINYDDIFWDMILLMTFLTNAFLGMCFKLWDIFSEIQEEKDWDSKFVIVKPVIVIILSCFHTIFLFYPIVMATENFSGIAHYEDTQKLMEIIRYVGQDQMTFMFLFLVSAWFYGMYFVGLETAFSLIWFKKANVNIKTQIAEV